MTSKKEKQKRSSAHFYNLQFLPFHFQFSTSALSNFPSFSLFLPCHSFPGRSTKKEKKKKKKKTVKIVRGHCPPACYVTGIFRVGKNQSGVNHIMTVKIRPKKITVWLSSTTFLGVGAGGWIFFFF